MRVQEMTRIADAERDGIQVRIKEIARFRGIRSNQLVGYGIVVGLEGTGDSRKTPFTATLMANALKDFGTMVDPKDFQPRNIAAVAITADLPPFATPGNAIDVTVQSIGDAKSLQGGTLLRSPLYGHADKEKAIAVAQGSISIGGFNVSAGGNAVQKNHVNAGRIPDGAIVESAVPYQATFDGKVFLELDQPDITTSLRIAEKLNLVMPQLRAKAFDGGTVEIHVPSSDNLVQMMSMIESTTIMADTAGVVVINERTGTITMGGNVRLGPAVVAHGSLNIQIQTEPIISQPPPFSNGNTVVGQLTTVEASESKAKVGLIVPNTTVADLAKIFQTLRLTPRDIIAILEALKQQGSLKARIKVQ